MPEASVNIFGSVDVEGVLNDFSSKITAYYEGKDPTVKYPEAVPGLVDLLLRKASNPCLIGYYESATIPNYTRLISSKRHTVGYAIQDSDTETINGIKYLKNTYNLSIRAMNNETICWWGHAISPGSHIQPVISDILKARPATGRPEQFTNFTRDNTTFYYVSNAKNTQDPSKGFITETRSVYDITCELNGQIDSIVNYDLEILLLSGAFEYKGSLISVPIVKLVVDPSVRIVGSY